MKWYKCVIFEANTNREYSSNILSKLEEIICSAANKDVALFESSNPDPDITTWWLTEKAAELADIHCPEWRSNYSSITESGLPPQNKRLALLVGTVKSFKLLAPEISRNQKNYPKTVEEAIEKILASISEETKQQIKSTSEKELIMLHFGLGMAIRNKFGLWAGNNELLKSCGSETMHPDDASMVIIKALRNRLLNK